MKFVIKRVVNKINNKVDTFKKNRFTTYIVDYKKEGDNLRITSNMGVSRIVKDTPENQARLNQVIVKNKLEIAKKIDAYENTSKERLAVLMINILFLGISGGLVPLTFFIGNYLIFILSIFLFSFLSLAISVITVDYYVLVEEIKNLKNITGYKKDTEFNFPKISFKNIKNEIK